MNDHTLEKLREAIKKKDQELILLLNQRAELSLAVGQIKKESGMEVYDPSRERQVYQYISEMNQGPLSQTVVQDLFREIISVSRALQGPVTVAYFGPPASFTHLAALAHFGQTARFNPQKTIALVFEETERERDTYGVAPCENSSEGSVKATLDRLISTSLSIRAEVYLKISHYLLAAHDHRERIKRVYSHPQAIGQCQDWLEKNLPQCQVIEAENTAQAVQKVLEDQEGAAIGSLPAAQLYDLKILADRIEDSALNTTRFLVLGKGQSAPTGTDKTSIVFGTSHKPGSLFRVLEVFARQELNLLRIESYPLPDRVWEYLFFVDFAGHRQEDKVRKGLQDIKKVTTFIKVLGSYPRGDTI